MDLVLSELMEKPSNGKAKCDSEIKYTIDSVRRHYRGSHSQEFKEVRPRKKPSVSALQLVGRTDVTSSSKYWSLLVELQCEHNLPSRIFDSARMRKLMMIYDSSFNITTNSDNLEREMHDYHQRLITTIREELNGGIISLKFDLASRRYRSVLGVTIQYIRDWKIIIRTINNSNE